MKILIIGGGAAGFFAAIRAAEQVPDANVTILERGRNVLEKVLISGGGRCNLTHACFVPKELVKFYPRGHKELLSPFNKFCTGDTMEWFEKRGAALKIEDDGRVFPISDNSETVAYTLIQAAEKAKVFVETQTRVDDIIPPQKVGGNWLVLTNKGNFEADKLMIATGSNTRIWDLLKKMGHTIIDPVPSLFTFNIKDARIRDLAGISLENLKLKIPNTPLEANGDLLITHWGMSGPAILKLSAYGARDLHKLNYNFHLQINWTGAFSTQTVIEDFYQYKNTEGKRHIGKYTMYDIPMRLWKNLLTHVHIPHDAQWANIHKKDILAFAKELTDSQFWVTGKSTFKDEFVTAGGVSLLEIDFKYFESKLHKNLFLAGEVLDIDAVTGGFNFQAAWTGGYLAGSAMGQKT